MGKLSQVTKGRLERPIRVVMYGSPGSGKTTFGADAPSPIFLPAEEGTNQLDVARFPAPASWKDALESIDELVREAHTYRTLVVDTLDALEPLCWQHVCATRLDKQGKRHDSIEGYGYGAGYVLALDEWRGFVRRLDACRDKGLNVILIAHSHVRAFKSPDTDDYERFEMKLHKTAIPVVTEWADAVLFARHEVLTRDVGTGERKRTKAVTSEARILHTQDGTAWFAKNRYGLPATLPLSWEAFAEAVVTGRAQPDVDTREQIAELLRDQDAALAERVNAAVAKAGDDAAHLAKILNRLRATVAPKEKSA